MSQKAYNEDAFVIHPVPDEEVQEVLFVHASLAALQRFSLALRASETQKLVKDIFTSIMGVLEQLIEFVSKNNDREHEKTEGIIMRKKKIQARQKIIRELKVVDVIADILFYPFKNKLYSFNDLTQQDLLTQICQQCYIFLKFAVSDNRINELYASQWIELYFDHAMRATAQNNLLAEVAITELVQNNKRLLDKQISKENIRKFIELCKN